MSRSPLPYARRMFVDTSAYFAVINRRDVNQPAAGAIMEQLVAERRRLFTTNFILAELHALLLTRINRVIAAVALDLVQASRATTIVRVSARDEPRARDILRHYDDKDFSLTDATSFAVMERLHISQAFTLDNNFAQFGFAIVGPATPDI